MERYFILNLILAVTTLSVSCPTEVQGNKGLDDPTRDLYNYPWRRFNHLKRYDEKALDGQFLFGEDNNYTSYPIYYRNPMPMNDDDLKSKKSSTNEKPFNNVQLGYGIKVIYGRVPDTVIFLPSTA